MSRIALVTGCRGAIGRAIASRLMSDGFRVVAHSRGAVDDDLPDVEWLDGDLTDTAVIGRISRGLPRVDVLVNNAASQETGTLDSLSDTDWSTMVDATLMSAVRLATALRPAIPPGGAVVNVSSVEASSAYPRHAHYAAAKAALESFTRSAALEWASDGIRVNAVAPGLVDRPGLAQGWPEGWDWWGRTSPLGRPVTADEVAGAVAFLATAPGISGVVLPVDGGWSASARLT